MSTRTDALAPIHIRGRDYPDRGYCYDSGYEGPVVHTTYCTYDPTDTAVSGSECIKVGQDGAAIARAREQAADRRRFTPPEYRTSSTGAHEQGTKTVITVDRQQVTDTVVLRGRPRGADGMGTGPWTTWEVLAEDSGHRRSLDGLFAARGRKGRLPVDADAVIDAASLVAQFAARVPHYEFAVVRARLVVDEKRLA